MVALRTPRLTPLAYDEELIALRLLTDRHDELAHLRVQTVNRLHRLLTELIPGGAKHDLSALQAKRLLVTVRPRTLVGKTIRRIAAEEISDLVAVDAKLKAIKTELRAAVTARGSHLMDLFGVGPAGAARILLADRVLPLVRELARERDGDDLLFVTESGHRLHASALKRTVAWSTISGGRRIHDLRQTAACLWLARGVDAATVQAWMGHTSIATTNIYLHHLGTGADRPVLTI